MKKSKWNYAVVKSIFGDYWVGKTKLKPLKEIIFTDIKDAIEKAQELFKLHKPEFDPDLCEDEDNYDEDYRAFTEIGETTEETAEKISNGIEKFIVKNY